ncbi:14441_t:CDS:1, partial [Racocetra persica]
SCAQVAENLPAEILTPITSTQEMPYIPAATQDTPHDINTFQDKESHTE